MERSVEMEAAVGEFEVTLLAGLNLPLRLGKVLGKRHGDQDRSMVTHRSTAENVFGLVPSKAGRIGRRLEDFAFQHRPGCRGIEAGFGIAVVDGDGKGSVAVWSGGDRVRGHRGGILSIFKLNLDINSPLALTLRGGTIAQVNMGWLLAHIQTIGSREFTVSQQGADDVLSAPVHEAAPNDDVVREVYVFDPSGLPLEGFQYGVNDLLLKHVVFSDCHLDVALPPSTWQI